MQLRDDDGWPGLLGLTLWAAAMVPLAASGFSPGPDGAPLLPRPLAVVGCLVLGLTWLSCVVVVLVRRRRSQ